jgi:hypothetical protein
MEIDSWNDLHISKTELPPSFLPIQAEKLDPEIWGPHYWFFLQTVAQTYPENPTSVTKRKYYDLVQNIPLFIPNPEIGDRFSQLLDKFPVSPYLDSRDSFVRWVHFMHNKINVLLDKQQITLFEALDRYKQLYIPKHVKLSERYHIRKEYVLLIFSILLLIFIWIMNFTSR